MHLLKLSSGTQNSAQKKICASASLLFEKNLEDLDNFTKSTIPGIKKSNEEIMGTLEQLGRQSQALIKKKK